MAENKHLAIDNGEKSHKQSDDWVKNNVHPRLYGLISLALGVGLFILVSSGTGGLGDGITFAHIVGYFGSAMMTVGGIFYILKGKYVDK